MTDLTKLQSRAWTVCCDFHDRSEDIQAHLLRWQAEYGKTKDGVEILPPEGWKILPFLTVIHGPHREYHNEYGWLSPRRGISTMTPIFARPSGVTRVFAVPG